VFDAFEMFDILRGSPIDRCMPERGAGNQRLACHLIHIAACPPDASRHPVWNNNSKFDHVSWESLPKEFTQVGDNQYELVLFLIGLSAFY
jgi:hypothetical protein